MKQISIRKTSTAEVRVTRDTYKGRQTIDIRVWFLDASSGDYVPSSKGVTLDAGKGSELIEALKALV